MSLNEATEILNVRDIKDIEKVNKVRFNFKYFLNSVIFSANLLN